jgi:hypothetical protein
VSLKILSSQRDKRGELAIVVCRTDAAGKCACPERPAHLAFRWGSPPEGVSPEADQKQCEREALLLAAAAPGA